MPVKAQELAWRLLWRHRSSTRPDSNVPWWATTRLLCCPGGKRRISRGSISLATCVKLVTWREQRLTQGMEMSTRTPEAENCPRCARRRLTRNSVCSYCGTNLEAGREEAGNDGLQETNSQQPLDRAPHSLADALQSTRTFNTQLPSIPQDPPLAKDWPLPTTTGRGVIVPLWLVVVATVGLTLTTTGLFVIGTMFFFSRPLAPAIESDSARAEVPARPVPARPVPTQQPVQIPPPDEPTPIEIPLQRPKDRLPPVIKDPPPVIKDPIKPFRRRLPVPSRPRYSL